MAAKIKKGDYVVVIAGKDKGRKGEVTKVFTKESRVLVSGVHMVKRHVRPSQADPDGGIKQFEAPIHVSNVAHIDPNDGVGRANVDFHSSLYKRRVPGVAYFDPGAP